jgi:hypothetical protein
MIPKLTVVIPGREQRQLRVSPESIPPGANDTNAIAAPRRRAVWIPGLHFSRLRLLKCIPE